MKFRYKVLLINLIILSIMLGVTGYLLVYRSYKMSMDTELRNAVSENNIVKASLEYELLDVLNSKTYNLSSDIGSIAKRIDSGMLLSGSTMYVMAGDKYVYSGDSMENQIPVSLIDSVKSGKKYVYQNGGGEHFLYISTPGYINKSSLYIITKKDISNVYKQLEENLKFLKIISIIVLCVSMLIIYLLTFFLTRPLEKLSKITTRISGGDYSVRADVKSDDEVGDLAESFNSMAGSVEDHVEELKDMVHRRDQFVADFTHEMKTPMTTIIGYADSVRHLDLTEEERNMSLDYIYAEGKRLETMSQKLFELIYLKSNDIFMEELDMPSLGEDIVMHMKPIMDRKNITIKTDFEDGEIYGDNELIKTVFINLLDNARKASEEGAEVYFGGRVKRVDGEKIADNIKNEGVNGKSDHNEKVYEIVVRDYGIGISEEDQKRIFDEFFMVDKSRTRKEGGAGLGMSLVAIILERHGAKIRIESELGKGTAFYTEWKMNSDELSS